MPETLRTFGSVGPFALVLTRTATQSGPGGFARAALALTLENGSDRRSVASFEDGAIATATAAGEAIISAVAAAGGAVTLGGAPAAPIPANGSTGAATYTRAVTLTPGTPVPPGRGVIVNGGGTFVLKLQGGGVVSLYDKTGGGGGTQYDGFAVVDADLTKTGDNSTVQVLY